MIIRAISDLHGTFPTVEPCDLLIVAGDVCPDGFGGRWARKYPELQWNWFVETFIPWVRPLAKRVLVTWGNHDFCGRLHKNEIIDNVVIACDGLVQIDNLSIWLTPWSNQFMDWAFMQPHEDLAEVYGEIPAGIDILVSHQPPYGCGDVYPIFGEPGPGHIGSNELCYTIERIQPQVVICGHLHGGYGVYRIGDTHVFNVSVVDEAYTLRHPATDIPYADLHTPASETVPAAAPSDTPGETR